MIELEFIASGLKCAVIVATMGHRCGYVGVPSTHQLFKKDYDDIMNNINVHGGLTYSDSFLNGIDSTDTWWFGYDCAHIDDCSMYGGYEKSLKYCERECELLAEQLCNYDEVRDEQ